jgi:hypothetical protein
MTGYIVTEPDLTIERVPEPLLDWEDILWPPHINGLEALEPGQVPTFHSPNELYHRHPLPGAEHMAYVWTRRDPNGLPTRVIAKLRELTAPET